jgi:hypothetical protein
MANYANTPADIRPPANYNAQSKIGGEAFGAGEWVYMDLTTRRYKKAACTSLATANAEGQALTACDADGGSFILLPGSGEYKPGANMTKGEDVVLSATPGRMCPRADLVAGNILTRLGTVSVTGSSATMRVNIDATGITL